MSYSVGSKYEYPQSKSGLSYDNKAYSGSRGQVYNDGQYAEHPDFSRKQKSGRGKCIAIGLVCFVLLAAAIAVGIYFGVRSKSDDDEPEVATTVQTTLILDENWDPNLEDPTSAAYIAKKKEVEDGIDVLMEGVDGYKDSTVVGFFQGSIGADTKIEMTKNTIPDQAGVKKAITADRMKDFLKRKVASAKAKNNAFASKIMADKIDASPQTGAIGNTDLGYACSKNTDCEDKNTECTGTTKVCTCKSGFFNKRDKGGLCSISKAYGAMCTMDKECALPKMMCSSRKCACKTETHWKNQQCMDNIDIDRAGCTADDECKSGATCVQGTCRCPAEKMKKNNMCTEKVDINQQGCTADEDCKAGKCVSTYCRCPEDTVYDKGDCKDKSDTGKYCSGENLDGAIYSNCNDAWEAHQSKGEQRHLVQFVGCMWFHAYTIKRENCDIDNLLKELSKSRLNKAGRIMQLTNEDREALAKMAREVQSPSDLCNQPMPVRYIAEHSCFKVAPSFTDDEKCVVRLFAKGCVRHTMMSSGVNCTVAQINTMFNHDFVKTGLMDNFPTTTCENSLTSCESKFIRGSFAKFPCLGFLGEASLYSKYKSNLPSIGSSDGTHQLTCSLWRGVHKCMKSYIDTLQCSPQEVNQVAAIFAKAVIKVVLYETVKGDPKLGTVDDFTVTDFSQNCAVSDVTAPADSCPSKSFMADTMFVICAVQVEYTKKMHPGIDNCVIPIKDCMHEKMESLYEAFGCQANPEDSLPALLMEKSIWLTQMFEFNVQECMDVAQCVKKMREHEYQGCMDFQGLVMQDHNLKDQDEVCASVDVVTDHLIPACIKKYDDIDSKCEQLAKKIWMRVYSEVKTYLNRTTTRFENCAAHSVGTCAAQSIKTLFKCYGLYFRSEGECRVLQCITSTTTPQGCSTKFDPIDVLQRAEIIYGKQPECDIQDCGVGIFPQAAGSMCKLGWLKWKSETNSAEKCRIYQSFLGCTAFNLLIRGEQICGFATLHQNIVATASKFGYNPTICTSSSFQQMDNQFAKTRGEVCRNDFIYRSILSDYTPLPVGLFAGNTERNQCMREVAKKVELYTIFLTSGLIECTNQIVWEHAATEAVRKDIFDLSSGCENNYNCTVLTLSYGEALTHCSTFMTNTLFLSSIFDVDTENAFETDAESLKCRAFNMATGCVVNILKDCMGNIADVQDGLRILANSGTINSPYAVKKADIFNSCPSYSISEVSACPPANYLPDMVTVYCTIEPAFAIRSGASMKDACDAVWKCIEGVVGSVKDCPGIPEAAVELMSPTTLAKFENRSGLACKPYAVGSYCASKLYQHDECSSLAGLVMIENKLMSRNEKCASVHLILKELLPNCVKNHGLPAECSEHIPGIWHEMLEHVMEEAGIVETTLDKCDDYVVNECEAQEITTLFRCYGNHQVKEGGCSTIGCIEAATSSCPSKPLNKIAVYKWADMIYGDLPECQLPECGQRVFNMMAAGGCAPAWNAWVAGTTATDKCQAYEAFLGCIAFTYRAYSANFCGFQKLHTNIASEAKKIYSQEPTLCNGDTPAMLDAMFPQTSADVCNNRFVIRSMLNFFCPSSITAFTGTEEKKKCMDEMKRTKCLIDSIQDSFKDCKTETIKDAVNTQEIRAGIFELDPGCDNTYPCIKAAIMKPDMAACSQLLVNLLLMTKYGVEVSTATAMDSTDKLKCKFWEIATGCALTVVPECQNKAMEAQDALKIMTTYHLMEYPEMAVHVDTFDECPAFPSTFNPCPDGEYYVYSVIGYCGLSAVDMFRNGYHPDIACSSMLSCSGLITASLISCPGIAETAKTLTTDKSRAYIGDLTTLSCPRPGECPALKDDSVGTCVEECKDDTGCPNMQKCCFNGCGHTCQEPGDY